MFDERRFVKRSELLASLAPPHPAPEWVGALLKRLAVLRADQVRELAPYVRCDACRSCVVRCTFNRWAALRANKSRERASAAGRPSLPPVRVLKTVYA
jgi:hypothetical protein